MSEIKIPTGFRNWLQFYDHINKSIPLDDPKAPILNFFDRNRNSTIQQSSIKIETLKAKCFDELNSKRISRNLTNKLLSKYHYIEVGMEDYDEIATLIEIMTLPE